MTDTSSPGIEADAAVSLSFSIGKLTDEMRAERLARAREAQRRIPIYVPIVGSGTGGTSTLMIGCGKPNGWPIQAATPRVRLRCCGH